MIKCSAVLATALFFVTALPSTARAISIDIAPVNGGLVGIRGADPAIQKYFEVDGDGIQRPVDGLSVVVRNHTFTWTPAVSTGLIFRFGAEADSEKVRLGLGTHFVVFGEGNNTRTAPAITLNVGTKTKQAFVGLLLTASDEIRFPGDTDKHKPKTVVVPTGDADSFVVRRTSKRFSFFAGVVFPIH